MAIRENALETNLATGSRGALFIWHSGGTRGIIDACHKEARRLLGTHRVQLDLLAEALVARETLDGQEILAVTGLPPAPALDTSKSAAAATSPARAGMVRPQ